jgi:hypothetical protein
MGDSQISVARKSNGEWVPDSHIMTGNVDLSHLSASQGGDAGRWITWIMHIKCADVNSFNGVAEIWKDGKKILSQTRLENWHPTANYLDVGYLLGWANSGFTQTTDFYIDNIIFATSGEDVGIGGVRPNPPILTGVE